MGGGIFYNFSLIVVPIVNTSNLCQNRTSDSNRSEDEQEWVVHDEQIDEYGCYDKKNHSILYSHQRMIYLLNSGTLDDSPLVFAVTHLVKRVKAALVRRHLCDKVCVVLLVRTHNRLSVN